MKSFLLLTSLAFFFLEINAQPAYSIFVTVPDTAASIFSQNLCKVRVSEIPINNENGRYIFNVTMSIDTSFLAIKFPGFDWIMVRKYKSLKVINGFLPFVEVNDNLLENIYINLLPLYNEIPGLLESAQNGTTVLVRYQMYASIDADPYNYMYSNVDTMYLPAASSDDIAAYEYLQDHVRNMRQFSYLLKDEGVTLNISQYIINNFSESLIFDLAKFQIMKIELSETIRNNPSLSNAELVDLLKAQYEVLKTSKSELVKSQAKRW